MLLHKKKEYKDVRKLFIKKLGKDLVADKRVRFLVTGGMNTTFSFLAYSLLVVFGVAPHLSIVIMYPISIMHSYIWNKIFTFRSKNKSAKELLKFVLVYVIIFGINYGVVYALTEIFHINPFAAGMIALSISTIMSYLCHSRFTFNKKTI